MPRNSFDPPVSQWITDCGCIIQGVMMKESEINRIYCPIHKKEVHVHSFYREINMHKSPNKYDEELADQLKKQYCWSHG
jgi:hypothetical protein